MTVSTRSGALRTDRALLVLEDGTIYRGYGYGATGASLGEAVFSTGMTGYQETLTDPSYAGQIVAQTAPHIGNTGVNTTDAESRKIWVAGYVVRDAARVASKKNSSNRVSLASRGSTPAPSPAASAHTGQCAPESSQDAKPTDPTKNSSAKYAHPNPWLAVN